MFELIDAYRSILHFAAWTGLSVGMLAALGALAWFGWQIPLVRRFVVVGALCVGCGYAGLIHGGAVERADVLAAWDKARRDAAIAAKQRDADHEAEIRAEYLREIAALQHAADDRDQEERTLEATIKAMGSAGRCRLGPEPLRLRRAAGPK